MRIQNTDTFEINRVIAHQVELLMKNLVRGLLHHCLLYLVIHSLKFFLSANGFSLLLTKIQLIERKKKRRGEEKGGYKMLSITAFALFMQLCFSQNGGYSCFYIL